MNDLRDNSDDDGDMDDLMKSMGINLSLAPSSSSTTTLRTIADYALQKKIGEGARSEVYLVHHINISSSSNDECMCFAMKLCKRSKLRKMKFLVSNHAGVGAMYSALDELYREIEVLRHLKQCGPAERCQMVTVLHDVIEDDEEDEIALILDYSSSGSIASYDVLTRSWNINEIINTAGKHSLSDEDMLYYIYQMAQAVDFLHRNQVAHRDLKPEHFLIQQGGKRLVLSDFGNAQKFEGSDLVQDTKGTMIYWAPECIEPDRFSKDKDLGWDLEKEESPNEVGQSGFSAYLLDTWALGVCIYSLYYHTFPFACYDSFGPDAEIKIMETLQLICTSEPSFKLHPNFRGDQVLNAQGVVKDIITGLLTKTPYERWSVANCLDYSRSS